jgi:hypothetical protein
MWLIRCSTLLTDAPFGDFPPRIENHTLISLSHEALVGVVVKVHVRMVRQLVGRQIVKDDVDLAIRVGGHGFI